MITLLKANQGKWIQKNYTNTYNSNFPWLDETNYKKMVSDINKLWISEENKEMAMNERYRNNIKYIQNDNVLKERWKTLNEQAYQAAELNNSQANAQLRMSEFSQALKKKYNLDATANDLDVFNTFIESLWTEWINLAWQYLSWENKKLRYEAWLETLPEKYADFMAWVMQSPGKRWYNLVWQWVDKAAKRWAEQILGKEIDDAYETGREATDITNVLVWEERANSKATKAGEVVWDIASWIALTAPMWAAIAPTLANSSVVWAWLLWGAEWFLDTALTHYWTQWNLDLSPTEIALWVWWWVLWGELTRYLANMPKSQADNIRKEAEWYINKSIKPKTNANVSQADVNKFTDDVLDVAKVMSKNKWTEVLQYTDDAWNLVTWKLPTNLRETTETLNNLKRVVYDQYDDIARKAWDAWARVDLNKVFDNLDDLTKDIPTNLSNWNALNTIDDLKTRLLQYSDDMWTISIKDAQDTVQQFNNQLTTFFKNISNSSDDVSKNAITAKVNKWMLDAIDDSIDDTLNAWIKWGSSASAEYNQLRHFYGQIKNIEKEIAKRTMQDMKKMPWMTSQLLDAFSGWEFTQAILTLDPVTFWKAWIIKLINKYFQYINNPNVNISKLFKLVDSVNNPNIASSTLTNVWDAVRQWLQNSAGVIPTAVVPWSIAAWESLQS